MSHLTDAIKIAKMNRQCGVKIEPVISPTIGAITDAAASLLAEKDAHLGQTVGVFDLKGGKRRRMSRITTMAKPAKRKCKSSTAG